MNPWLSEEERQASLALVAEAKAVVARLETIERLGNGAWIHALAHAQMALNDSIFILERMGNESTDHARALYTSYLRDSMKRAYATGAKLGWPGFEPEKDKGAQ